MQLLNNNMLHICIVYMHVFVRMMYACHKARHKEPMSTQLSQLHSGHTFSHDISGSGNVILVLRRSNILLLIDSYNVD